LKLLLPDLGSTDWQWHTGFVNARLTPVHA